MQCILRACVCVRVRARACVHACDTVPCHSVRCHVVSCRFVPFRAMLCHDVSCVHVCVHVCRRAGGRARARAGGQPGARVCALTAFVVVAHACAGAQIFGQKTKQDLHALIGKEFKAFVLSRTTDEHGTPPPPPPPACTHACTQEFTPACMCPCRHPIVQHKGLPILLQR